MRRSALGNRRQPRKEGAAALRLQQKDTAPDFCRRAMQQAMQHAMPGLYALRFPRQLGGSAQSFGQRRIGLNDLGYPFLHGQLEPGRDGVFILFQAGAILDAITDDQINRRAPDVFARRLQKPFKLHGIIARHELVAQAKKDFRLPAQAAARFGVSEFQR